MTEHDDGMSRRKVLECMTWAGTGVLWTITGGVPASLGIIDEAMAAPAKGFTFLQISDSHMGFDKPANPNVKGTLEEAIARVKTLPVKPSFMIHTGDISHLSKPSEFDDADQIISRAGLNVRYVPGEHDLLDEDQGKLYLDRYGRGTKGAGWYSFDDNGVHFIGLVNVVNLKAGGLGNLGNDQLEWLEDDLKWPLGFTADRRLRAHSALDGLSRVGMGHGRRCAGAWLPQALRLGDRAQRAHPPGHAEGRGQRHFPYRALDSVPAAGAWHGAVARPNESAGRQITQHAWHRQRDLQAERAAARHHRHADPELRAAMTMIKTLTRLLVAGVAAAYLHAAAPASAEEVAVKIGNFTFGPQELKVKAGTTVTWTNEDDIPHTVVSANTFRSKVMDTDGKFSFTFTTPGTYKYFCSLHPHMTGTVIVEAPTGSLSP